MMWRWEIVFLALHCGGVILIQLRSVSGIAFMVVEFILFSAELDQSLMDGDV